MDSFLSQFKTGVKLTAGFGVLIVFLLGIGGYGMKSSLQLGALLHDMYEVRVNAITLMDEVNLLTVRHNRTIFSLAAEQDTSVIDDILREMKDYESEINKRMDAFSKSADLSDAEKKALANFKTYWPQYLDKIKFVEKPARVSVSKKIAIFVSVMSSFCPSSGFIKSNQSIAQSSSTSKKEKMMMRKKPKHKRRWSIRVWPDIDDAVWREG